MSASIWSEYGTLLMWAAGQLVVAGAIWGGIKSDIRAIHMEIRTKHEASMQRHAATESSANEAHARIDRLLERRAYDRSTGTPN